jgi:hypothetical protein
MAHLLHFFSVFLIDLVPRPLHPRALVVGLSLGKNPSRPLHVELTEAEKGVVAMGRVQFEGAAETPIRSLWYQGGMLYTKTYMYNNKNPLHSGVLVFLVGLEDMAAQAEAGSAHHCLLQSISNNPSCLAFSFFKQSFFIPF